MKLTTLSSLYLNPYSKLKLYFQIQVLFVAETLKENRLEER